jgi:hypothetical protein
LLRFDTADEFQHFDRTEGAQRLGTVFWVELGQQLLDPLPDLQRGLFPPLLS